MDKYVLLDVGGTEIKGCTCDENGNIDKDMQYFSAHSREDKITIFDNFASVILELASGVIKTDKNARIKGVGMAFPGPFDYKNGISLMKNLDKYEDIYGKPIEIEIKSRLKENKVANLKEADFCFLHDVEAFGLGASKAIGAKKDDKIFCLSIGTGAGSAFIQGDVALKKKENGVPENGWIYNAPFRESIIDDYISARGLAKLSESIIGKAYSGKELFDLCESGDKNAREVYRLFGEMIAEAIETFLDSFKPDVLVIGGQITKSFEYFGNAIKGECTGRNIKIHLEKNTSLMAAKGLFLEMKRSKNYA